MRIGISSIWAGVGSLAFLGCAPASGTQPQAMSATEHQAAANAEEMTSESHASEYRPEQSVTRRHCSHLDRRSARGCWTSEENPTAEHLQEVERHRELAARHRAASELLRSAEAAACWGIPDDDRDLSPFSHREDIRSVSPLEERLSAQEGLAFSYEVVGARIVFAAVPGMTVEWLQRVVDCHLARNAAIGHDVASAEMASCPLTPRGVQARVQSVGDGFAVDVRADDAKTIQEIVRRAESVQPRSVSR